MPVRLQDHRTTTGTPEIVEQDASLYFDGIALSSAQKSIRDKTRY